jgi:hypothetical protein
MQSTTPLGMRQSLLPSGEIDGAEISWRSSLNAGDAAHAGIHPADRSFSFDPGRLDDRPPFLDFGFLKSTERLRRLLVGRENLLPEVSQPRPHRRDGQSVDGRGIEFGDDVLRRAFGPTLTPEASRAFCGDPIGLDGAGPHLRQGGGWIGESKIDLTGHQVLDSRGGAAIRHQLKPRTCFFLEE